jgi:hypothetical protein
MPGIAWGILALAFLAALYILFPTERRMRRNISRNAGKPMRSVSSDWAVAGVVIAICIVVVGLVALGVL